MEEEQHRPASWTAGVRLVPWRTELALREWDGQPYLKVSVNRRVADEAPAVDVAGDVLGAMERDMSFAVRQFIGNSLEGNLVDLSEGEGDMLGSAIAGDRVEGDREIDFTKTALRRMADGRPYRHNIVRMYDDQTEQRAAGERDDRVASMISRAETFLAVCGTMSLARYEFLKRLDFAIVFSAFLGARPFRCGHTVEAVLEMGRRRLPPSLEDEGDQTRLFLAMRTPAWPFWLWASTLETLSMSPNARVPPVLRNVFSSSHVMRGNSEAIARFDAFSALLSSPEPLWTALRGSTYGGEFMCATFLRRFAKSLRDDTERVRSREIESIWFRPPPRMLLSLVERDDRNNVRLLADSIMNKHRTRGRHDIHVDLDRPCYVFLGVPPDCLRIGVPEESEKEVMRALENVISRDNMVLFAQDNPSTLRALFAISVQRMGPKPWLLFHSEACLLSEAAPEEFVEKTQTLKSVYTGDLFLVGEAPDASALSPARPDMELFRPLTRPGAKPSTLATRWAFGWHAWQQNQCGEALRELLDAPEDVQTWFQRSILGSGGIEEALDTLESAMRNYMMIAARFASPRGLWRDRASIREFRPSLGQRIWLLCLFGSLARRDVRVLQLLFSALERRPPVAFADRHLLITLFLAYGIAEYRPLEPFVSARDRRLFEGVRGKQLWIPKYREPEHIEEREAALLGPESRGRRWIPLVRDLVAVLEGAEKPGDLPWATCTVHPDMASGGGFFGTVGQMLWPFHDPWDIARELEALFAMLTGILSLFRSDLNFRRDAAEKYIRTQRTLFLGQLSPRFLCRENLALAENMVPARIARLAALFAVSAPGMSTYYEAAVTIARKFDLPDVPATMDRFVDAAAGNAEFLKDMFRARHGIAVVPTNHVRLCLWVISGTVESSERFPAARATSPFTGAREMWDIGMWRISPVLHAASREEGVRAHAVARPFFASLSAGEEVLWATADAAQEEYVTVRQRHSLDVMRRAGGERATSVPPEYDFFVVPHKVHRQ